jgi:hypothetical protein
VGKVRNPIPETVDLKLQKGYDDIEESAILANTSVYLSEMLFVSGQPCIFVAG